MITGKDIIHGQMAHDTSLGATKIVRESLLEISRNNKAIVSDENDNAQEERRECEKYLRKNYLISSRPFSEEVYRMVQDKISEHFFFIYNSAAA